VAGVDLVSLFPFFDDIPHARRGRETFPIKKKKKGKKDVQNKV
jgi:hypothetical protein